MAQGQEIKWKCSCLGYEVTQHVRYRRADEDAVTWMHDVVQAEIVKLHRALSPRCPRTTLEYAKIFVAENAETLGGKPKVH